MTFALAVVPIVLLLLGFPIFMVLLTAVTVARIPARVHTSFDIRFTLIDDVRAASGLSAAARMAVPYLVRRRKNASASIDETK